MAAQFDENLIKLMSFITPEKLEDLFKDADVTLKFSEKFQLAAEFDSVEFDDDERAEKGRLAQAFYWYSMAAVNHLEAKFQVAMKYLNGEGIKKSPEQAFFWFKRAGELGFVRAQYNLALLLYDGLGCDLDKKEAFVWFEHAAVGDDVDAQFNVAEMYYQGMGVEKNLEEAAEWYSRAAEQGDAEAQYKFAQMHEKGEGLEQDNELAYEWFLKAANQDHRDAQFKLAKKHDLGEGVGKNLRVALSWYQKAAMNDHPDAQYIMGLMLDPNENSVCEDSVDQHVLDESLKKNWETSFQWYLKAANNHNIEAQYQVALRYQKGAGVLQSFERALSWLQKAADNGVCQAQFDLAYQFYRGIHIPRDEKKAFFWFQKAALQGHSTAQYLCGLLSETSDLGVNQHQVIHWYTLAANSGDVDAQRCLGERYATGYTVEQDIDAAVFWCRMAALQDDKEAQYTLAILLEIINENDKKESMDWLHQAAKNNHAEAQFLLATKLEKGEGIDQDLENALFWYTLAAENGHPAAQHFLAVLEQEFSSYMSHHGNCNGIRSEEGIEIEHIDKVVSPLLLSKEARGLEAQVQGLNNNSVSNSNTNDNACTLSLSIIPRLAVLV